MARRGIFGGRGRTRSPDNANEDPAPAPPGEEAGVTTGETVTLGGTPVPGEGTATPPPAEPTTPTAL